MNLARIRMLECPYDRVFREAPLPRRVSGAAASAVYGLLAQAFQASEVALPLES